MQIPLMKKKQKAVYPTKTTLNLAMRESSQVRLSQFVPLLVLILAAAILFGKFAVANRLGTIEADQAALAETQQKIAQLQQATADYGQLQTQYGRYTVSWMAEEERDLTDRSIALSILEDRLMSAAQVERFSLTGNILSVELVDTSLGSTSTLIQSLYQVPEVKNVAVYTAQNDEENTERVSLIITLSAHPEGGAQE